MSVLDRLQGSNSLNVQQPTSGGAVNTSQTIPTPPPTNKPKANQQFIVPPQLWQLVEDFVRSFRFSVNKLVKIPVYWGNPFRKSQF